VITDQVREKIQKQLFHKYFPDTTKLLPDPNMPMHGHIPVTLEDKSHAFLPEYQHGKGYQFILQQLLIIC